MVAAEKKGKKLGRIRLQVIENCSGDELIPFIQANIAPGSSVVTDGWNGYNKLEKEGYTHHQVLQAKAEKKESVLPGVHMVASLIKRVFLGTYHGRLEKNTFSATWMNTRFDSIVEIQNMSVNDFIELFNKL